jgi:antibiotic biosynthesis monooxygenase (ABM) superfamily enzyme
MTVVSWLGIFPLVVLYAAVLGPILPAGMPAVVRYLVVTASVVPTMSYVLAPRLTRLFRNWLYPKRA